MYMRIGEDKLLVTNCRFGKGLLVINDRYIITSYVLDTRFKERFHEIEIHKEIYNLPEDFKKIEKLLEEM
ncbi:MAG: hypothetical protein ACRCX2_28735 [Paraclostridium sp.]